VEDLLIRKVRIGDAAVIGRIQEKITKSTIETDFKQIINEHLRSDDDVSLVAEIDGKIVGYMISYIMYAGFGLDKSAWIATLGVEPKLMGHGIGKRLAEKILQIYEEKGIKHIFTSVSWDSVDLLSFFKTLGFDRSNFINLSKKLDS
jgi:predicted N-acetyltransferase YhbS